MAPFTKPETVIKQADGLISVGQTRAALQSLTEMFSSKKFRTTPLASLEPIMLRFLELCVNLRKGRIAKEGLMQYKNIAQNTNTTSIEVVVKKFIQLADAKVQEAQEQAEKVATAEIDDLEASEIPEDILLRAVSGDQSKDRTDRALVTPWLRFLWEGYRNVLETLKNNARVEVIYQVSSFFLWRMLGLGFMKVPSSKSRIKHSSSVSNMVEKSNSGVFARYFDCI
jgi:translation initiation factor 3 subunit A